MLFISIPYFKSQVTFLNFHLISKDLKYHFRYVSADFWSWGITKTTRYSKIWGGDYVNFQVLTVSPVSGKIEMCLNM